MLSAAFPRQDQASTGRALFGAGAAHDPFPGGGRFESQRSDGGVLGGDGGRSRDRNGRLPVIQREPEQQHADPGERDQPASPIEAGRAIGAKVARAPPGAGFQQIAALGAKIRSIKDAGHRAEVTAGWHRSIAETPAGAPVESENRSLFGRARLATSAAL